MASDGFEEIVEETLEELPRPFQEKLENVEVFVEDFADRETLDELGIDSRYELLGLYRGLPVTQRSFFQHWPMPDRIILYRVPILYAAGPRGDVSRVIRHVVIHEVGHHFGFDDEELARLEDESS